MLSPAMEGPCQYGGPLRLPIFRSQAAAQKFWQTADVGKAQTVQQLQIWADQVLVRSTTPRGRGGQ